MMNALQTLIDNGCTNETITEILTDLLGQDNFDDDADKRCCIAMLHDWENDNRNDPDGYSISYGNVVDAPCGEYLVLDDDEADIMCAEYIEESVWAFISSFLASETGIDEDVFVALSDKCEDGNKAVLSLIKGTCGLEEFIENAILADGRGPYLARYDSNEHEINAGYNTYYVFRVN